LGGLQHSVLLGPPLIELGEYLVDFVEKELGRRRNLGREIHGARPRIDSLIPIVSNRIAVVEKG
jgi:hypothetical protein